MGILICGLNGSGKSTIGRKLAERLSYRFIDIEYIYFQKSDLSYKYDYSRKEDEVIKILEEETSEDRRFVLTSVIGDFGNRFLSTLDVIVYIEAEREERLRRVFSRSYEEYGERMLPGGDLYEKENSFLSWISQRSDDYVNNWLATIDCPVIRIDGMQPVDENIEYLLSVLGQYVK